MAVIRSLSLAVVAMENRISREYSSVSFECRLRRYLMSAPLSKLFPARGFVAPVVLTSGSSPTRQTEIYRRIKSALDAVPAIDTHDHLWPFDKLPGYVETDRGRGMNLSSLWRNSYYTWNHPLPAWQPGGKFDDWWAKAKHS